MKSLTHRIVRPMVRPITIETGYTRYAEGSVLIKIGHTHVLCTASIDEHLPAWLVGKKQGWITAEYSMLPRATHTRTKRERQQSSGRSQEIQRLIGRALRSTTQLELLGPRSILIDCDVLQADGGTRTAAITGGCVALRMALAQLIVNGKIPKEVWIDCVAGVSVGIKEQAILVDLNYAEDSTCEIDMNFVLRGLDQCIEIQGTAERQFFKKQDLDAMFEAAAQAIGTIRQVQIDTLASLGIY